MSFDQNLKHFGLAMAVRTEAAPTPLAVLKRLFSQTYIVHHLQIIQQTYLTKITNAVGFGKG